MAAAASVHAARDRAGRVPRLRPLASSAGRPWRRLGWPLAAILLWLAAGALDRTTELEVFSDGGRIHLRVAGSTLSAGVAVSSLSAVEIRAADSIDPPGGRRIRISSEGRQILDERLPRRFEIPPGDLVPLGDWELDELGGEGVVWRRQLVVRGPFTLRADFRGRTLRDLSLVLRGEPTTSIVFRRGLINNDCSILDASGVTLAVTSTDPTPPVDAGAAIALVLRAAAVASLLIGIFALLASGSPPRPLPTASRRWRAPPWIAFGLALTAVAISAWVAGGVLEALPHQPDSVVYLLQARWLLDGALWGEVSPFQDHLSLPYTYVEAGRWLAHYPVGWPLFLAAGLAVGIPWLVAPLLGGLFIVLLYLTGRELDGPELGLGAATLGLISPMARLIFGSMLSHAAGATLVLAALWLTLAARRRSSRPAAAAAGAALGVAFGIRPLTALAIAVPFAAVLLFDLLTSRKHRDAGRRLLAVLAGGLATAAPTLIANHLITGQALAFPYTLAQRSMYLLDNLWFGLRNLDALLASTCAAISGWGWDLVHGPLVLALALAFACVPFLLRRARPTDWLLLAMVVSVLIAHLGTRGHGLHGFGPRYYFEIFACLYLLTARGFQELARMGADPDHARKRTPAAAALALFLVLNLTAVAVLPRRLALYHGYNGVDGSLERQVAAANPGRALVLFATDDWQGWAMAARMMETGPDADLLFAEGDPDDPAFRQLAGDRELYLWHDGRLVQVEDEKF